MRVGSRLRAAIGRRTDPMPTAFRGFGGALKGTAADSGRGTEPHHRGCDEMRVARDQARSAAMNGEVSVG